MHLFVSICDESMSAFIAVAALANIESFLVGYFGIGRKQHYFSIFIY
jgi:hypothetical protein